MEPPQCDPHDLIRACLEAISPNLSGVEWINVLAVCNEHGLKPREVFDLVGRSRAIFTGPDFSTCWSWASRRPPGIAGLGTLVHYVQRDGRNQHHVNDELRRIRGGYPDELPSILNGKQKSQEYLYPESDGVYRATVRYECPAASGPTEILPFHSYRDSRWEMGHGHGLWPLFWLGTLDAKEIDFVEGESCACELAQLYRPRFVEEALEREADLAVVTSQGGLSRIDKTDWGVLADRHVYVWPAGDEPGTQYADRVVEMARLVGAASVRVCRPFSGAELPCELGGSPDVTDYVRWVTRRGGLAGRRLARSELSRCRGAAVVRVADARCWSINSALESVFDQLAFTHEQNLLGLRLRSWPKVQDAIRGLRGLHLIEGAPKIGKSQLALQWAFDVLDSNGLACVIYITLRSSREDLATRMVARRAGLTYQLVTTGDSQLHLASNLLRLDDLDSMKLDRARAALDKYGPRLALVDQRHLPFNFIYQAIRQDTWVEDFASFVEAYKAKSGSDRALVVIDDLQGVTSTVSNPADEIDHKSAILERLRRVCSRLAQGRLDGDALVLISESPESASPAGGERGDVLGSTRGVFRADGVWELAHRRTQESELWGSASKNPPQLALTLTAGGSGVTPTQMYLSWTDRFSELRED